jgi:predicted acetyltransferase
MARIVIKGVETAEELDAAKDLMARVHFSDYYQGMRWLDITDQGYPEYKREHNRMLFADGELAAALRLFTYTVRIGEARLKMGGFGCVTTAGPMRQRGYAAMLMGDSMRYLHAHGYHVSTLFGIADFYHRWGFASALPEYASVIEVREAAAVSLAGIQASCHETGRYSRCAADAHPKRHRNSLFHHQAGQTYFMSLGQVAHCANHYGR